MAGEKTCLQKAEKDKVMLVMDNGYCIKISKDILACDVYGNIWGWKMGYIYFI